MRNDIIQQIRDAYTENPAKAIKLLPELFKTVDDGKIVELPCKVGDTIYTAKHQIRKYCKDTSEYGRKVMAIRITAKGTKIKVANLDYFPESDFGKTVFSTNDALSAALKEREK